MAQRITLKIAGKEYPYSAKDPEMEHTMRVAAEKINKTFDDFAQKYLETPWEDKLIFILLNETVNEIACRERMVALKQEMDELNRRLESYLEMSEKK